ncbi:hypothetical protein ACLOJK_012373 [Asimina triloba]
MTTHISLSSFFFLIPENHRFHHLDICTNCQSPHPIFQRSPNNLKSLDHHVGSQSIMNLWINVKTQPFPSIPSKLVVPTPHRIPSEDIRSCRNCFRRLMMMNASASASTGWDVLAESSTWEDDGGVTSDAGTDESMSLMQGLIRPFFMKWGLSYRIFPISNAGSQSPPIDFRRAGKIHTARTHICPAAADG